MTTRESGDGGRAGEVQEVQLPTLYTRNATGLVREVSLTGMIFFSATSPGPIAGLLAWGLFWALVSFPAGNLLLGIGIGLVALLFVWVVFALLAATLPKVGGDYVYNSRVLHPALGFGGNVAMWITAVLGVPLWLTWMVNLGLVPVFNQIGALTGHPGWSSVAQTISSKNWVFVIELIGIAILTVISIAGTKVAIRALSSLYVAGFFSFLIPFLILLFTSHASFVTHLNSFSQEFTGVPDTYGATIDAATKAGLALPGISGFSLRSTVGDILVTIEVLVWFFWGVYLAGEMRQGGRRQRQLAAILGAGVGQSLLVLAGAAVLLKTVGYDFLAAANAGYYKAPVSPYFTYFALLIRPNSALAILIGILFLSLFLPAAYINLAMAQRAPFAWAFDRLAPQWLTKVSDRTHTPIASILFASALCVLGAAWSAYSVSFITILGVTLLLGFTTIGLVSVGAIIMSSRRPEIYRGSPADWKIGNVSVLAVAGVFGLATSLFALVGGIVFHAEVGISKLGWAIGLPLVVLAFGGVYFYAARALQRRRGVDLDLIYETIPPD